MKLHCDTTPTPNQNNSPLPKIIHKRNPLPSEHSPMISLPSSHSLLNSNKSSSTDNQVERQSVVNLRKYQHHLFHRAITENLLINLPPGSGKTAIALNLLRHSLPQTHGPFPSHSRRSIYLAPTVTLLTQTYTLLLSSLPVPIAIVTGLDKPTLWSGSEWSQLFQSHHILLFTPVTLLTALTKGHIHMSNINLLIFDEAHHALSQQTTKFKVNQTNSKPAPQPPYRQLLNIFSQQTAGLPEAAKPRILGLSASIFSNMELTTNPQEMIQEIETIFQAKIVSEDIENFGLSAQVFINCIDDDSFRQTMAEHQRTNSDIFSPILTMLSSLNSENSEITETLHKAITKIQAILYQDLGPWFANEALTLYKESLIGQNVASFLKPLVPYLLHFFNQIETSLRSQFYSSSNWNNLEFALNSPKTLKVSNLLEFCKILQPTGLNAIIFVHERLHANLIYRWIRLLAGNQPDYSFIKPAFICGSVNQKFLRFDPIEPHFKERFQSGHLNLIIATSVLEEGIDLPACNFVLRYDFPADFRAYLHSKGRARNFESFFVLMVDEANRKMASQKLEKFLKVEEFMVKFQKERAEELKKLREFEDQEALLKEIEEALQGFSAKMVTEGGFELTELNSLKLLRSYLDFFDKSSSIFETEERPNPENPSGPNLRRAFLNLPENCPVSGQVYGKFRRRIKSAMQSCAFEVLKRLYEEGQLNEELVRVCPKESLGSFLEQHRLELNLKVAFGEKMKLKHLEKDLGDDDSDEESRDSWRESLIRQPTVYFSRLFQEPFPDPATRTYHFYSLDYLNFYSLFGLSDGMTTFGFLTTRRLPAQRIESIIYQNETSVKFRILEQTEKIELASEEPSTELVKFFHYHLLENILATGLKVEKKNGPDEEKEATFSVDRFRDKPDLGFYFIPVKKNEDSSFELNLDLMKNLLEWMRQTEGLHKNILDCQIERNIPEISELPSETIIVPLHWKVLNLHIVGGQGDGETVPLYPRDTFKKRRKAPKELGSSEAEGVLQTVTYIEYFEESYGIKLKNTELPLIAISQRSLSENLGKFWKCSDSYRVPKAGKYEESGGLMQFPVELVSFPYPMKIGQVQLASTLPAVIYRLEQYLKAHEFLEQEILGPNNGSLEYDETFNLDQLVTEKTYFNQHFKRSQEDLEDDQNLSNLEPDFEEYRRLCSEDIEKPKKSFFSDESKDLKGHKPDLAMDSTDSQALITEFGQILSQIDAETCNFDYLPPATPTSGDYLTFGETSSFLFEGDITQHINLSFDTFTQVHYPNPWTIAKALTMHRSADIWSLEQLETVGDAFFKMTTVLHLFFAYPAYDEGQLSQLKVALICNGNLEGLALEKGLQNWVQSQILAIGENWRNPVLTVDGVEEGVDSFMVPQEVLGKYLADSVEALIGALLFYGSAGAALRLYDWLGLVYFTPDKWIDSGLLSPMKNVVASEFDAKHHEDVRNVVKEAYQLGMFRGVEAKIGYQFKEKYHLVQAFTHPSYRPNRNYTSLLGSYQRLEFIGDSILDYLITHFIYHRNPTLTSEEISNIRASLVGNAFYASIIVKYNLHVYFQASSLVLEEAIGTFVRRYKAKLGKTTVMEQSDTEEEEIEVPKVLADVFEALIGAIYLDNGFSLDGVWRIVYRMIKFEFDYFLENVPQSALAWLEKNFVHRYSFAEPTSVNLEKKEIVLTIQLEAQGASQLFTGAGSNTKQCKVNAAKKAMRKLGEKGE